VTPTDFENLILGLSGLPKETEWVEFKVNKTNPQEIGKNISALSNSAALLFKTCAYIIWGIEDKTHNIVGTAFQPEHTKVGNEELENWLIRLLDPRLDFRIYKDNMNGKPIILLEVPPAFNRPVRFSGAEYIRIGSYTKRLKDYPEKERALWRIFDNVPFEEGIAKKEVTDDEVLNLVDYPKYFTLMAEPLLEKSAILDRFVSENIIQKCASGKFNITNVGAILFARNLSNFNRLARKAIRVIIYKGNNRVETVKEQEGAKGYAVGFQGVIRYVNDQLPQNEQIGQALRKEVRVYPEIAIRELVANALIHQDFSITGAGPLVEIFADRMEVSNPGEPLIDTLRFMDEPPRSRNEYLASLMRRMSICEERGSGIDKVIFNVEAFQLPAPDFRVAGASTIAILFGPRKFSEMTRDERIRACYQHACLQQLCGQRLSNATLRKRLGIAQSNYPQASKIIKDTLEKGLIKTPTGGSDSKRDATYMPFWA